jgi:hypothetical protein
LLLLEKYECSHYLGGVLDKGLFSANLAFWNNLREISDSYFKSEKSYDFIKQTINRERLIEVKKLNEFYLK